MPQRLLLEGGDIDELLLRVQNEHGPQARIVHAEQKLVGGIAGFFARRRYELAVQVDDEDLTLPVTTEQPAPASSFDELLAKADGADGGAEDRPADRRSPRAPEWSADGRHPAAELPVQRGRQLSTQTPQFENLLSKIGRAHV